MIYKLVYIHNYNLYFIQIFVYLLKCCMSKYIFSKLYIYVTRIFKTNNNVLSGLSYYNVQANI